MAECSFHEHQLPPLSSVRPLSPSPKDPTHIHRDLNNVLQVNVQHYHSSGENTCMFGTKQFVQKHICLRCEAPPGEGEEYVARAC